MSIKDISRRDFIKGAVATTVTVAITPHYACSAAKSPYDAKGLPTTILGKTGVEVPRLAFGTGSRFCAVTDEEKALESLTYALDNGLYYWDTAWIYRNGDIISEERLGKILKDRRQEVFLSTKVTTRDADEAKKHIEQSLKRLQTDHLDILKVHDVQSVEDVESFTKKGGVLDVLRKLRDEGVAKNIGFSGHTSAKAMAKAAKDYDFDTMLIALNHYSEGRENFEQQAVPLAAEKGLGVIVMKVIRPRETVEGISAKELIQYALSLKHPNAIVVSHDSMQVLKENISLLKNFKPLDAEKMKELQMTLAPFYRHEGLEWMQPNYHDGCLA